MAFNVKIFFPVYFEASKVWLNLNTETNFDKYATLGEM